MKLFGHLLPVVFAAFLFAGCGSNQRTFVTIGTGGVTGVYYPVGGALAKLINESETAGSIKATAESTGGSVFNINALMSGDIEFGIVQSDRQAQALAGTKEWEELGPQTDLRAICSLYPESVNLVAAVDAGITNLLSLTGKRVNIGNPGSGNRGNAIDALDAAGLDYQNDIISEQIKASEAAKLLQDGRIDAYFYTAGHPNGSFKEVSVGRRKVRFVPITELDDLLSRSPFYAHSQIPIKHYPNIQNEADVPTFGVKATLCTSSKVSDDTVYTVTKVLFENLQQFKQLHPALEQLEGSSMLEGLSAPIHPGAERYYREAGLIK
jgi:TRAP transporter TAXI family solute receptor